jgi:hypothetical protein
VIESHKRSRRYRCCPATGEAGPGVAARRFRRRLCALLLATLLGPGGCTSTPASLEDGNVRAQPTSEAEAEQETENVDESRCSEALANAFAGGWASWAGLPADCELTDVEAVVSEVAEARGRGSLGLEHVTTESTTARHPQLDKPLKIWLRDDGVRLIEVSYPRVEDAYSVLTTKLGEPEAKLDYYQRTLLYERSAYVYPRRGLALFFNPDRSALISIYLFAPTSLDTYQRELHHPVEPGRRLPQRLD